MKYLIPILTLLALPAYADDGGVVGAAMATINSGMTNNNAGDPGYSGSDND